MELKPSQFEHFFRAIHGCNPFPWQQALVDQLAETDAWPDILDLPTGAGKTAVLDAAVFHLALRAVTPEKVAIRIALVVDRRLVVDDAYARAKRIANVLDGIETSKEQLAKEERAVIAEVSKRLRRLTGGEGPPLVAERLRGGVPLEAEWVRMPTQPTILCSTVDQVGSRLLFRGYGVSDRMKPVHAGLLGQDSLILLDEAHLSQPFWQTLSSLQRVGRAEIRTALLSATPGSNPQTPLKLSRGDRRHPLLKKRLEASKPVRLYKQPYKGQEEFVQALAEVASDMARRMAKAGVPASAVGIVVNRVFLARKTFEQLAIQQPEANILLMIGRARSVVRDSIVNCKLKPFRTNSAERASAAPLFVVATQCLEVGVDLDLDGLVTQAAPLDALRQRFGRLNRAGREDVCAEGAILTLAKDVAANTDDPIYGKQTRATWNALKKLSQNGIVNFGIDQAENWSQDLPDLVAPKSDAPVLMPAYLDLWSQTWPVPTADPDVNLFLHGVTHSSADVSLVWRSDLKKADMKKSRERALEKFVGLVPPRPGEMLEIPLWAARKWLTESTSTEGISDVPGRDCSDSIRSEVVARPAFRWAGRDNSHTKVVKCLNDIGPGDVLIVPAEYGGCDHFGWAPESKCPVEDVADQAAFPDVADQEGLPRGYAVRVASDCVKTERQWEKLAAILEVDGAAVTDTIDRLIDVFSLIETEESSCDDQEAEQPIRHVRARLEELRKQPRSIVIHRYAGDLTVANADDDIRCAILIVQKGPTSFSGACGASTEDDSLSHSASSTVSLKDHSQHVEDWAKSFCRNLRFPTHLEEDITLAAFLHDAGKADPRFQIMLRGGQIWDQSNDNAVIAKSGQPWINSAWRRAKLPKGWRHESLSVRMARAHPRFAQARDPRLILWLIGTHHGFGRPFFNFADDSTGIGPLSCLGIDTELISSGPGPESMAFDYDGDDWSSLFEKLKERYGMWRLAQFEAILRLADHRASEKGRGA